jgi:hypothetical protein
MIVQTIVSKLKESGVKLNEEAIEKLVNDENTKIEFPAVLLWNYVGNPHVVCTLLPSSIYCRE